MSTSIPAHPALAFRSDILSMLIAWGSCHLGLYRLGQLVLPIRLDPLRLKLFVAVSFVFRPNAEQFHVYLTGFINRYADSYGSADDLPAMAAADSGRIDSGKHGVNLFVP